jgi:hypothetical protein
LIHRGFPRPLGYPCLGCYHVHIKSWLVFRIEVDSPCSCTCGSWLSQHFSYSCQLTGNCKRGKQEHCNAEIVRTGRRQEFKQEKCKHTMESVSRHRPSVLDNSLSIYHYTTTAPLLQCKYSYTWVESPVQGLLSLHCKQPESVQLRLGHLQVCLKVVQRHRSSLQNWPNYCAEHQTVVPTTPPISQL